MEELIKITSLAEAAKELMLRAEEQDKDWAEAINLIKTHIHTLSET